jgi:hypothetical protein
MNVCVCVYAAALIVALCFKPDAGTWTALISAISVRALVSRFSSHARNCHSHSLF